MSALVGLSSSTPTTLALSHFCSLAHLVGGLSLAADRKLVQDDENWLKQGPNTLQQHQQQTLLLPFLQVKAEVSFSHLAMDEEHLGTVE